MASAEKTAAAINRMLEAGAASRESSLSRRVARLVETHGETLDPELRTGLADIAEAARLSEAAAEAQSRAVLTLAAYILPGD